MPRLRPGGLVVLDNVFLAGRFFDPAYQEEHHLAMRRLNDAIVGDERVEAVMLPVRDGGDAGAQALITDALDELLSGIELRGWTEL